MSKAFHRDDSKTSSISYRWLFASLFVHALVLIAVAQFSGGSGPGYGKAGKQQDDAFTVTWIPGSGDAAGGSNVDTIVDDAEQGEPMGASAEVEVEVETESEKKPVFEVVETDPQKVFDESSAKSVLVSFDPNGTKPKKLEPFQEESDPSERPQENSDSKQASDKGLPTDPHSSVPNPSENPGKGRGANAGKGQGEEPSSGNGSNGIRFFGIFARARKVVYVIDASESMRKHNAMDIARNELLQSLKGLEQTAQFQVIFFDAQPHVMGGHRGGTKLLSANPRNLVLAEQFARGIEPESGTDRFAALNIALGFKPDVVFLLTDADDPKLSPQELFDLRRANKRRTSINVVEFGIKADLSTDSFLKQLAHENAGQHFYRDLTK